MQILQVRPSLNRTAVTECQLVRLLLVLILPVLVVGCSAIGSEVEVEAPATPTGVEATSQDAAIGLNWNAVDGADTYRVYRGTSSGVDVSGSSLDAGISSTDYVDETAENGTTYYYVVTAVAEEDGETAESDASNEVEKTPFSDPPDRP